MSISEYRASCALSFISTAGSPLLLQWDLIHKILFLNPLHVSTYKEWNCFRCRLSLCKAKIQPLNFYFQYIDLNFHYDILIAKVEGKSPQAKSTWDNMESWGDNWKRIKLWPFEYKLFFCLTNSIIS
jgi:hypothetical protein